MSRLTRLFLFFLAIELIMFGSISSINFKSQLILNSFITLRSSIVSQPFPLEVLAIFSHNLVVATLDLVPALGVAVFLFSMGSTAYVLSVISQGKGLEAFLGLLALPHSWLELPAYAIAAAGSLNFLMTEGSLISKLRKLTLIWLFIAFELLVAALFEASEINLSLPFQVILWLPAAASIFALWKLYSRVMRI